MQKKKAKTVEERLLSAADRRVKKRKAKLRKLRQQFQEAETELLADLAEAEAYRQFINKR